MRLPFFIRGQVRHFYTSSAVEALLRPVRPNALHWRNIFSRPTMPLLRPLLITVALAASHAHAAEQCGAFKRLNVATPPGFCAAVLADGFKFPRGIQPLPNGNLVVVDMGGWEVGCGSIWLLKAADGQCQKTQLL
jgi:hypothetical protein